MKALIVIDVPDDFETKTAIAIVDVKNEKGEGVIAMCPLKPMPSKRKSMVEWLHKDTQTYESTSTMWTHEITEYDKGWNDCVEFLEGEDND